MAAEPGSARWEPTPAREARERRDQRSRPARPADERPRQAPRPRGRRDRRPRRPRPCLAEELAETGVRAVVNVSRSTTGRFPNPGRSSSCGQASLSSTPPGRRSSTCSPTASSSASTAAASGGTGRSWRREPSSTPARSNKRSPSSRDGCRTRSRRSPRTPCATSRRRQGHSPRGSSCRRFVPDSGTGTRSSSRAAPATSQTFGWCAPTSATSGPCWSPSTAGRTRCAKSGSHRT